MTSLDLEFKFAWDWLLPTNRLKTYYLFGFESKEELYLQRKFLALKLMQCSISPELMVINDSQYNGIQEIQISQQFKTALVLCVVSNKNKLQYWRNVFCNELMNIREYGLLPASKPRLIIPLNSPRDAIMGLKLHRPGRLGARLACIIIQLLARIYNYTLLHNRVLLIASRNSNEFIGSAELVNLPLLQTKISYDFALYLGAPSTNRKTIALPVGRCVPEVILKIASSKIAKKSLRNEARALKELESSIISEHVPRLFEVSDGPQDLTLCVEYRQRRWSTKSKLDKSIVDFLIKLALINRDSKSLESELNQIDCYGFNSILNGELRFAYLQIYERLRDISKLKKPLLTHCSHGDFASWNYSWTKKGFYVYDWEESRFDDIAFGDVFYCSIAPAVEIYRNSNPVKILNTTLDLARSVSTLDYKNENNIQVYLAIWLLKKIKQKQEHYLYGELLLSLQRTWSS